MKEAVAQAEAIPALVALLKDGTTGEEKKIAAFTLLQLSSHRFIKDQLRPSPGGGSSRCILGEGPVFYF